MEKVLGGEAVLDVILMKDEMIRLLSHNPIDRKLTSLFFSADIPKGFWFQFLCCKALMRLCLT